MRSDNPPLLHLPDPPLAGARCALRAWAPDDLPELLAAGADPLVHRFRYSLPDDEDQARAWLAATGADRERGDRLELAVTEDGGGAAVGSVSLWGLHRRNRNAMMSYWLNERGRGRGLGSGAVRLLSGWAFSELGMARLALHVEVENVDSQRLAERCGFRREGRLRSHQQLRDGTRADVLIYGLLGGDSNR